MSHPRPRVSILIPNFNNGRTASKSGRRDFIGDLLESLRATLEHDPTPVEIIVADDGSTDDSLPTLREWAKRTWPDGRPFLDLIERPHCGVLSIVANALYRRAKGDFLVRLDGDVVCLTPNWASVLVRLFEEGPPRLGVIGPKQLTPDLRIHAMGDWILHPKGYHHVGQGLPRDAFQRAVEVDHVMGCFYCCRREVYEELEGFDEGILRGQTIDFGLRARLAGWSCIATPHIEFIHAHSERKTRETTADTGTGIGVALEAFERKWGFSRIAPDLDEVRARYAGTPLLWHARFRSFDEPPVEDPPAMLESTAWGRYASEEPVRRTIDFWLRVTGDVIAQVKPATVVDFEAGEGLLGHLLAQRGVQYVGIERRSDLVQLARQVTRGQTYPGPAPTYHRWINARTSPLEGASADLVLLLHIMERHPNPVALLKEARRTLRPGGHVLILTRRGAPGVESPLDYEHGYTASELVQQAMAVGGFEPASDPKANPGSPDIVLVLRRKPVAGTARRLAARETATALPHS